MAFEINELANRLETVGCYFALVHTPRLPLRNASFCLAARTKSHERGVRAIWQPSNHPSIFLLVDERKPGKQNFFFYTLGGLATMIRRRKMEPCWGIIDSALDWARFETHRMILLGEHMLEEQEAAIEQLRRLAAPLALAGVRPDRRWEDLPKVKLFQQTYPEYWTELEHQRSTANLMLLAVASSLLSRAARAMPTKEESLKAARLMISQQQRRPDRVLALCEKLHTGM